MTHSDISLRRPGGVRRSRLPALAAAGAAVLAVAACKPDNVLQVTDIDVASPTTVQDSSALPALLAGAIGDFGSMFGGGGDFNQVTLVGQLTDEFVNTETFPTRIEVDMRRQQYQNNGSLQGAFYAIQQARNSADNAAGAYAKFAPKDAGRAEALNLSALAYVLLAENYCGAVPISHQDASGAFVFGPALSTDQLLSVAVAKADSALNITSATDATGAAAYKTQQQRLARVVKARALLDQNKPAEAAAAIGGEAGVPSNFQYLYNHSETTGRQNNGTWATTNSVARFGEADVEGTNGLPFRSEGDQAGTVKDPRVANVRRTAGRGLGFDGSTPQWIQLKYPARSSPDIVADGVEARLIEAEAQLRANNYTGALATLNTLRTNASVFTARGYTGTLAALPSVAGTDAQVNQLFKERAYWLYLSAHRLGDMRRLIKFYARNPETVFPTGNYFKSGTYGTDVNSPVPQAEDNNPNFDRSACSTTKA